MPLSVGEVTGLAIGLKTRTQAADLQLAYEIRRQQDTPPKWYSRRTYCGTQMMPISVLGQKNGKFSAMRIAFCGSRYCTRCGPGIAAREAGILTVAARNFRIQTGGQIYFCVFHKRIPPHGWKDDMKSFYAAAHRWEQLRIRELTKKLHTLEAYGLLVYTRATEATARCPIGDGIGFLGGRLNTHMNMIVGLSPDADVVGIRRRLKELNTNALRLSYLALKSEGDYPEFCARVDEDKGLWDESLFHFSRVSELELERKLGYLAKGVGGLSASLLEITNGTAKRGRGKFSEGLFQLVRTAYNVDKIYKPWRRNWAKDAHLAWISALAAHKSRAYTHSKWLDNDGKKQNWIKYFGGEDIEDGDDFEVVPTHAYDGILEKHEISAIDESAIDSTGEAPEVVAGHKRCDTEQLKDMIQADVDAHHRMRAATLVKKGYVWSDYVLTWFFQSSDTARDSYVRKNVKQMPAKERPAVVPGSLKSDYREYLKAFKDKCKREKSLEVGDVRVRPQRSQVENGVTGEKKKMIVGTGAPSRAWWEPLVRGETCYHTADGKVRRISDV